MDSTVSRTRPMTILALAGQYEIQNRLRTLSWRRFYKAGVYQMGELHARSWITFWCSGAQQFAMPSGMVAGSSQRTPASAQMR